MPDPNTTDTCTTQGEIPNNIDSFLIDTEAPGLLVAHTPAAEIPTDRCLVNGRLEVGRSGGCDLTIRDGTLSSRHFCIVEAEGGSAIRDLGSTNGTYLDGLPVRGDVRLRHQSVIRAGGSIFVFLRNAGPMMRGVPSDRFGMAGRFHTPLFIRQLEETAASERNILLVGETGTGKELAAKAIAHVMGGPNRPLPLWIFNAARFASHEEAASTLFGVAPRFFSNVDAREGLIEKANRGLLFIDELHNMPEQSQRMLLRVIEEGQVARLGESSMRRVDVRFVLSSNESGTTFGLAHDLFARLRLITTAPLNSRIADVPALFKSILGDMLTRRGQKNGEIVDWISPDHLEALCLEDYAAGNVRKLVDLSDRLVTRIAISGRQREAVHEIFGEHFGGCVIAKRGRSRADDKKKISPYEQNKRLIITAYRENQQNLSKTVRALNKTGFRCSRRWITVFLKKWGEKQ